MKSRNFKYLQTVKNSQTKMSKLCKMRAVGRFYYFFNIQFIKIKKSYFRVLSLESSKISPKA